MTKTTKTVATQSATTKKTSGKKSASVTAVTPAVRRASARPASDKIDTAAPVITPVVADKKSKKLKAIAGGLAALKDLTPIAGGTTFAPEIPEVPGPQTDSETGTQTETITPEVPETQTDSNSTEMPATQPQTETIQTATDVNPVSQLIPPATKVSLYADPATGLALLQAAVNAGRVSKKSDSTVITGLVQLEQQESKGVLRSCYVVVVGKKKKGGEQYQSYWCDVVERYLTVIPPVEAIAAKLELAESADNL